MKNKIKYDDLTPEQKGLLQAAHYAMGNAYQPYSRFRVGAAVLTTRDRKIFSGCNVENAAYTGPHAEDIAIGKAVSEGYTEFEAIAVMGYEDGKSMEDAISPCGDCRQKIIEFANECGKDIDVIMSNPPMTTIKIWKISKLLPLAFKIRA